MSRPSFAAIGIYAPGQSKPSLMSANSRVIVFDHAEQARQYLPLLGAVVRRAGKIRTTSTGCPCISRASTAPAY